MECELPAAVDLGYNEDHRYSTTNNDHQQQQQDDDEEEEEVLPNPYGMIRPMEEESVRRIVAGQAVTDLASAVKELVDNSLDARSSSINIRLFNQGLDIVEVSDDGCGVPTTSRPFLAKAHATSKIQHFHDLYNGDRLTLGFRGEALFCLANLSEQLVVATRTQDEPMAQQMRYLRDGSLDATSLRNVPRKVGTTVAVFQLLNTVPVRRTDMTRRIVQQRAKLLRFMEGYAIFSVGVKINVYDVMGNRETVLLSTANSSSVQQTVSSVLGSRVLNQLTAVVVDLTPVVRNNTNTNNDKPQDDDDNNEMFQWKLDGLISKAPVKGSKENNNNNVRMGQQYFSINGRPVELPKVARVLGDVWRTFGGKNKPSCVLTLTLPNNEYDVNLTPEKRQVMLTHEAEILDHIKTGISNLWSSQTDGQFTPSTAAQRPTSPVNTNKNNKKRQREAKSVVSSMAFAAAAAAAADFAGELDDDDDDDNNNSNQNNIEVDTGYREEAPLTPNTSMRRNAHKRRGGFVHDISNAKVFDRPPPTPKDEYFVMPSMDDDDDDDEDDHVHNDSEMKENDCDNQNASMDESKNKEDGDDNEDCADGSTKWISAMAAERAALENDKPHDQQPNASSAKAIAGTNSDRDRLRWTDMQSRFNSSGLVDPAKEIDNLNRTTSPAKTARVTPSAGINAGGSSKAFNLEQFAFGTKSQTPPSSHTPVSEVVAPEEDELERSAKRGRSGSNAAALTQSAELERLTKRHSPYPEMKAVAAAAGRQRESPAECNSPPHDDGGRTQESEAVSSGDESPSPADPSLEAPSNLVWEAFANVEDVVAASREERRDMFECKRKLREARAADSKGKGADVTDGTGNDKHDNGQVTFVKLAKGDFAGMKVIGQFNHGFILALCPRNHLWILDQHACDEKYNFERLIEETAIYEQRLIAPMPLELDPSEENCVLDNMEIFKQNGFRFHFDPDKPPRHRLSLTSLPHSGARDGRKAVQFGREDVSALCAILGGSSGQDDEGDDIIHMGFGGGTGTDGSGSFGNNAVRRYAGSSSQVIQGDTAEKIITRLPKAIAMFASRACRGSIMIGKSLSHSEMERIVKRLDDVEHPWNCPHGRPTMTYGVNLQPALLADQKEVEDYHNEPIPARFLSQLGGGDEKEEEENDNDEEEEYEEEDQGEE